MTRIGKRKYFRFKVTPNKEKETNHLHCEELNLTIEIPFGTKFEKASTQLIEFLQQKGMKHKIVKGWYTKTLFADVIVE